MVELTELIKENNFDADIYLKSLKNHIDGAGVRDKIKNLEGFLNRYEYENAQSVLSEIAIELKIFLK